jgi:hypothetical protein
VVETVRGDVTKRLLTLQDLPAIYSRSRVGRSSYDITNKKTDPLALQLEILSVEIGGIRSVDGMKVSPALYD